MMARKSTKQKTASPKPRNSAGRMKLEHALSCPVARDLAKHAVEKCIYAVRDSQTLSDDLATRIVIALECASAVLLYQTAEIKYHTGSEESLQSMFPKLVASMQELVNPEIFKSGEVMLATTNLRKGEQDA